MRVHFSFRSGIWMTPPKHQFQLPDCIISHMESQFLINQNKVVKKQSMRKVQMKYFLLITSSNLSFVPFSCVMLSYWFSMIKWDVLPPLLWFQIFTERENCYSIGSFESREAIWDGMGQVNHNGGPKPKRRKVGIRVRRMWIAVLGQIKFREFLLFFK